VVCVSLCEFVCGVFVGVWGSVCVCVSEYGVCECV